MGPFPHDAPAAQVTPENPAGTDGFGFVEYAPPEPQKLHELFRIMGFSPVAKHRSKTIALYRQGDVNYLVNEEPGSHAVQFAGEHGPCASSMAFRVVDAQHAYRRAIELGAEPVDPVQGSLATDVPVVKGIGGSLLYLDRLIGHAGRESAPARPACGHPGGSRNSADLPQRGTGDYSAADTARP